MPPLEAWKKVLVSSDFLSSKHGELACTECHGGRGTKQTMEAAHKEIVIVDPVANCDRCHPGLSANHQASLHVSLEGYRETIRQRAGQSVLSPELESMMQTACSSCHTSCGQCHISRPKSVGGGFTGGHVFKKRPNMILNCAACHGSRIGEEFRGDHVGIAADVHYNKGMQCDACHDADEVHTSDANSMHRYDESLTQCQDCHQVGNENAYHAVHGDKLSCQVCHSQSYKNCYSCHVGKESRGLQRPSELGFKIGKNYLKSAARPYDYTVVRHVPISPNSYEEWAPGQLTNFSALPTWKYATPHNIQKNTPQTGDCTSSCHNNPDVFLTSADLDSASAEEQTANADVVVQNIPK